MNPLVCAALGFLAGCALSSFATAALYDRQRRRYGRFLSFVAHELNTPLTSMHMTVLNFIRGVFGPLAKDHEEWMQLLKEQTGRLGSLVGDLRDFVHLEFHRDLRLYPGPVDAAALVREALESSKGSTGRSGAAVEAELPAGLPPGWADPDRLARVLAGVLAHCRKFRASGPLRVRVRRAVQAKGVEVLFGYKGAALARAQAARMLDPFYPVDRPKSAVLDTVGLGLGVCRAVLERGGASLSFEVEADGASLIRIRLPQAPEGAAGPGT